MSATYADVDGGDDPSAAARWQDRIGAWPQVRAYKQHSYALLDGAQPIVDLGCGPGSDVIALGTDRCVGVDASTTMCATAAARGVTVCLADAHRLPFADGTFAAVRADRVIQHVADPPRALREAARVVRGRGRLVIADPDQESLVIHIPGVAQDLVDRVKAMRRDAAYRHGRLVSSLPAALTAMGMDEVSVDAFPLVLRDPDDAFGLPTWPHAWREQGGFAEGDLRSWDRGIERGRAGGFLFALVFFVVSGVKPHA